MPRQFISVVLLTSAILADPASAQSSKKSAIEEKIIATKPCEQVRVTKSFVRVAVDRFVDFDIAAFEVLLTEEQATLRATMTVRCKTSDQAMLTGDVVATLNVNAAARLNECRVIRNEVNIVSTGGTFGSLVRFFKSVLEGAIRNTIEKQIDKLCKALS